MAPGPHRYDTGRIEGSNPPTTPPQHKKVDLYGEILLTGVNTGVCSWGMCAMVGSPGNPGAAVLLQFTSGSHQLLAASGTPPGTQPANTGA